MDVKFCCAGKFYFGNLKDFSLEEILLGKTAEEIRDATKEGLVHDYCSPCYGIEKHGGNSQRTPIEFHRQSEIYSSKEYFPEEIDIRWSNTCNLACNYCLPHFSSRWADVLSIKIQSPSEEVHEKIFQFIEKYKENIQGVMLLGGEPLILKQNNRLLNMLPNRNFHMISNLSNPIQKNPIANKLFQEERVVWGISFENVKDRFEYVRDGADWNVFYNNLKMLKQGNKTLQFYPLYCVYSAFNLVEYYELVEEFEVKKLSWQLLLQNPLRVDTLSKDLISDAVKEIEIVEKKFSSSPGIKDLVNIKENLLKDIQEPKSNSKLLRWTTNLETNQFKKKKLFTELWPELYRRIVSSV
jgi:organic radical activating enzyme